MKSQIQVLILTIIVSLSSIVIAQPKLSVDFGMGVYQPTLSGFDENTGVPFPTESIFNRNLLMNWGIHKEIFSNFRMGYNSFTSFEIGELSLVNSEAVFYRSIRYRFFPIETYFRWRPRIEINFTLSPIWGRAKISVDTSPGDKSDDWNQLLNSFGDSDPMSGMGSTDAMRTDWIGFSGMIGGRFYLSSRLGFDFKMGFMNNSYSSSYDFIKNIGYSKDQWRLENTKVKGPDLKIDDLPIFSFKVIFGLK
jgi:hypothetical protein